MHPWLSVVMPTYNGERHLADALQSIASQSDPGIEVIVVDDGSTDRTLEIVRSYGMQIQLRIIEQPHIGNWVLNSNIGIRAASAPFVTMLHQDDAWTAGRAATLRDILGEAESFCRVSRYAEQSGDASEFVEDVTLPRCQSRGIIKACAENP